MKNAEGFKFIKKKHPRKNKKNQNRPDQTQQKQQAKKPDTKAEEEVVQVPEIEEKKE